MSKNKGFIGIGLIIAIVLGVAIVGGGAYYLGTNNSNKEVNPEKNILPINKDSSIPSITILSPNGGEVYKAGDKITVKWSTNNITNDAVWISLRKVSGNSEGSKSDDLWEIKTNNDGNEVIKLNDVSAGQYRIALYAYGTPRFQTDSGEVSDVSNNYFTINSSTNLITSCTSDKGKVMTYNKALEISKTSSCNSVGTFIGEYSCNKNAGGLVDVYMNPTNKPNCSFACRVSIDTGKAEEGWMCTGGSKLPVFPNNFPEGCGFNGELC